MISLRIAYHKQLNWEYIHSVKYVANITESKPSNKKPEANKTCNDPEID